MEFYMIFEGEGDSERIVYLNLAHVVEVSDENGRLFIHMSSGEAHEAAAKSVPAFRSFLNASKPN